jgi:hypothetical protein
VGIAHGGVGVEKPPHHVSVSSILLTPGERSLIFLKTKSSLFFVRFSHSRAYRLEEHENP